MPKKSCIKDTTYDPNCGGCWAVNEEKYSCDECKKLPEGIVIAWHDHRRICEECAKYNEIRPGSIHKVDARNCKMKCS
jgi:hypothetical protein